MWRFQVIHAPIKVHLASYTFRGKVDSAVVSKSWIQNYRCCFFRVACSIKHHRTQTKTQIDTRAFVRYSTLNHFLHRRRVGSRSSLPQARRLLRNICWKTRTRTCHRNSAHRKTTFRDASIFIRTDTRESVKSGDPKTQASLAAATIHLFVGWEGGRVETTGWARRARAINWQMSVNRKQRRCRVRC